MEDKISYSKLMLLVLILVLGNASSTSTTISVSHVNRNGNNSTTDNASSLVESSIVDRPKCRVMSADPFMANNIKHLLKVEKVSLIEYRLHFRNYSTSPLTGDTFTTYKLDEWSRVTTAQGQTLLSLAFNYGVLSMATLTLGTQELKVDLVDHPPGCMGAINEEEKIESIKYLLVRDFQDSLLPTLIDEERVCHEVILENNGYAIFRDRCYYQNPNTKKLIEDDNVENIWLEVLYVLLFIVRYSLIFFGPCLFITSVERMSSEQIPYVVKLKDALVKTIFITTSKNLQGLDLKYKRVVDLRNLKGFPKLQDSVSRNQSLIGKPIKVKFSQYDIKVDYRRLMTENTVEVGLLHSLYEAIFQCQIRSVGPFQVCCRANMLHGCPRTKKKKVPTATLR